MQYLSSIGLDLSRIQHAARANKAKELVHGYVRAKREAVTLVNELLTDGGASMDTFISKALRDKIDDVERIDRLTAVAESRRNASLREIDRRRAVLGETLRRSVQEIEDGEFEVIEPTAAEGKKSGLTSERKIRANRANARASTGPRTTWGRTRAARNALRHALSLPVCSIPDLSEEVQALAREIAGPGAEIQELARRVAEAQIDLRRVRYARHQFLS